MYNINKRNSVPIHIPWTVVLLKLCCPSLSPTDVHATALGEAGVPGGCAAH